MERTAILGIISFFKKKKKTIQHCSGRFNHLFSFSSFKLFMNLHSVIWESGGRILALECLYSKIPFKGERFEKKK